MSGTRERMRRLGEEWEVALPDSGIGAETIPKDPACRGYCEGERGALDSPARYGHTSDGSRVLWCKCCRQILRQASLKDYGPAVSKARLSGDTEMVRVTLYECPRCHYDVQSAKEIM